ncbi:MULTISPECIES: hypothetical protein [Corallococcus]|uniref:hypothetical protein n=1 Tax=Corallococcus TaxID=83461 RepID=UPI00117FB6D1|nr:MULTISPECIES: hypothetical protein [Corallococcus]NBD14409.1 hypothetical protein [Corallococcus silvisoli]TSC22694.1 hypothetical protein FOF48_32810 [Corallococcus sp. Z5C101001]
MLPIQRWGYRVALVAALAFPAVAYFSTFLWNSREAWSLATLIGTGAAYQLMSNWKALLNKETGILKLYSGVSVFFSSNTHPLESFTSVALSSPGKGSGNGSRFWGLYSVDLKSPTRTVPVSGSDDREEALELAQALSRFLGVDLTVEGGHARPAAARLEAAPLDDERALPSLPLGSRIRVRHGAQGLELRLPGCGWRPRFVVKAGIALVISLGCSTVFALLWARTLGFRQLASLQPLLILFALLSMGGLLLWTVIQEVTLGWSLTASSRGIEYSRTGSKRSQEITRIPASQIEDVDLRKADEKFFQNLGVVIEHRKGFVWLGEGLSREELEWTEMVLRRALATRQAPFHDDDASALRQTSMRS